MIDEWTRVSLAVGSRMMPVDAAEVLKQAIDKMITEGHVNPEHRWQALELLAAEYLAGP